MKVYLVMESYAGTSHVYNAHTTMKKAIAYIDYLVKCCEEDGWETDWVEGEMSYEHEVTLKSPKETDKFTVSYHIVERRVL